jgi:SAM-dependent methyltransferase
MIAGYYDSLSRFLDFARRIGRGGGSGSSATHRFLAAIAGEGDGTPGPERLDHIVLTAARASGLVAHPHVLDAGCGLGGTIFRWQEQVGGTFDGLTLSPEQQRRAAMEAARRDVSAACRFHVRSYHEPIMEPRDAVIAIESLAHSPDPLSAVENFARGLTPGGLLLIVDDMPEPTAGPRLLAGFKAGWQCPVLADAAAFHAAMTGAGLTVTHEDDLTPRLRPRPLAWLRVLIALFGLARRLAPTRGARDVIGAFLGGFYLEALYRTGGMRYLLMVARKA